MAIHQNNKFTADENTTYAGMIRREGARVKRPFGYVQQFPIFAWIINDSVITLKRISVELEVEGINALMYMCDNIDIATRDNFLRAIRTVCRDVHRKNKYQIPRRKSVIMTDDIFLHVYE